MIGFSNKLKIYIAITLASLFVILLGVNIYESVKDRIIDLSNKNKIAVSENILNVFQTWFDERINSLSRISIFMERLEVLKSESDTMDFIRIFADNSPEFDAVQLLKDDGVIYVNGKKILPSYSELYPRSSLIWYVETKDSGKPTVNFMPKHNVLDEGTLNFCVPNYLNGKFVAALCGIVKTGSIFENIRDFKLPPNSYSFIATHNGEILTPMEDYELQNLIQENFKELLLTDAGVKNFIIGSNFISTSEIKFINWFIGAGADNEKETSELLNIITKNALILLCAFILLAVVANYLHNIMYNKINRRKQEYEVILSHKAKMSEAGELISGINHQFIQPVNSLNLMISTLLMLELEGKLDRKTLRQMLENGSKSVTLLNDTISVFRNFYNTNESVSKFSVKQSVKNLLKLMHTQLSRNSVSVNLKDFKDQEIWQIQSFIQQILLILIHNAKDAVVEKFKDDRANRKIEIEVKFDDKKCYIRVIEFGKGVSEALQKRIFTTPKTTKKQGSGIGLYFAKKLANEKIGGDLCLINPAMPTIFELSFELNLRKKNDQ